MSEHSGLPLPSTNPMHARDIARGHIALAEQYRLADRLDMAREHERQAELWLRYARLLAAMEGAP